MAVRCSSTSSLLSSLKAPPSAWLTTPTCTGSPSAQGSQNLFLIHALQNLLPARQLSVLASLTRQDSAELYRRCRTTILDCKLEGLRPEQQTLCPCQDLQYVPISQHVLESLNPQPQSESAWQLQVPSLGGMA